MQGLLDLAPPHRHTIEDIREICKLKAQHMGNQMPYTGERLETRLFGSSGGKHKISPSSACYTLEVINQLTLHFSDRPSENG